MVRLYSRRLTPHPGNMYGSFPVNTHLPVCISLSFTINQSILQALPLAFPHIVPIQYKIALTGLTQTVSKQQITIFQCIKFGIGHLPFIFTQHRLQRIQPEGISLHTFTILQRSIVMIESHMQITFTVDTNTDNVVGILAFSFIR